MAITLPPPPANALAILTNAISDLQGADPNRAIGGSRVRAAPHPFPLYQLRLSGIRRGNDPLKSARQIGWRYLIEQGRSPSVADLYVTSGDDALEFGQLARGSPVERLVSRAHQADSLGGGRAVPMPDYEARILDVPALQVSALWLEGASPLFLLITPEDETEPLDADAFRALLIAAAGKVRSTPARQPR